MQAALETLEHYSTDDRLRVSRITTAVGGWLGELFGCQHKQMSRPFSRQGETYRVCIGCGARRQFDAKKWQLQGPFYYKEARTTDLMRY